MENKTSSILEGKDVITVKAINREIVEEIIHLTKALRELKETERNQLLRGKIMASLFFEVSTRTRTSFNMAMLTLGGAVEGFSDAAGTSVIKGESLWDTVKIYDGYGFDVMVLRHPLKGAAQLAAEVANIPVINAGDGSNQHPTQTLLDLYTIQESQGKIDGIKIAFVGDLRFGRTVHSLVEALTIFENCKFYFISPTDLSLPEYLLSLCLEKKIDFEIPTRIESVIKELDIVFMTRVQKERFKDQFLYEKVKNVFTLEKKMLKGVKENLRILHPLPRVHEISRDVDNTPHAYYFQQARNGLFVRQAILAALLGVKWS